MYFTEVNKTEVDENEILIKLDQEGFSRKLTDNQLKNLTKSCRLRCSANFSVPGAGKTTEAIVYYLFQKTNTNPLLVISPINAFLSWQNELKNALIKIQIL